MKPLFYIIRKSLKNIIKNISKKPLVLIGYIAAAVLIIGFIIMSVLTPASNIRGRSPEQFGILITGFLFVTIYLSLKQSIDTGSSFFRMADINFIFTAPIKSNKVLLYGFIKHSGTTLFVLMFLLFQVPNLKINFPLKNSGVFIILGSTFFLLLSLSLLGMLVYSMTSKSKNTRNIFMKALNIISALFILGFFITLYFTKDLMVAADNYLNSEILSYIPIIGWFKIVYFSAIKGITPQVYFNMILIILSLVGIGIGIYKLKTDYYEDVLAATEHREELIRAKKEGRGNINFYKNTMVKRNVKFNFLGNGALAIFSKNILEYKKIGFLLFDKTSLIIVLFGVSVRFFMPYPNTILILYWSIYILFIFSLQGRWSQELSKPYIYLIPVNPLYKLFFATLTENLKNFIDGIVLFTIVGFIYKSDFITIILSIISYTLFGSLFLYGDVLSRRIFGNIHSKVLKFFVKVFLILFILMPGIIASSILAFLYNSYVSLLLLIVYNFIGSFILLIIGKGVFSNIELD